MLSKKEVKDIQSLALKKHRDETKLFIAEGPKIVEELINLHPGQLKAVFALREWEGRPKVKGNIRFEEITDVELEKLSFLKTPNQVVALVKQFENTAPQTAGLLLYLDNIQDPGNMGTIIRTADWFGVSQIVCSAGCVDMYNPKVVQATMGSIARVKVYYDEDESWLGAQTIPVYAASLHGNNLDEMPAVSEGIILIGNESKGIRKEWLELAKEKITIPKKGNAESLNAAVATGIILSRLIK